MCLAVVSFTKSRLAAEAGEVIRIQQIEPCRDVRALGRDGFVQAVEVIAGVRIVRRTLFLLG